MKAITIIICPNTRYGCDVNKSMLDSKLIANYIEFDLKENEKYEAKIVENTFKILNKI